MDEIIVARIAGKEDREDDYGANYHYLKANRPKYEGGTLEDLIVEKQQYLLEKYPKEHELIENFILHAIASFNIVQGDNNNRGQLGKGQLRNVCMLLDRSPALQQMTPSLQTKILRIRQSLLYKCVMGLVRSNKQLGKEE